MNYDRDSYMRRQEEDHDMLSRRTRRPSRRPDPQQKVDAWNRTHSPGTPVLVSKDHHEVVRGKTTSQAYVLGGHSAVIHVDAISGCYALERVTADAAVAGLPGAPSSARSSSDTEG